MLAVSSGLVHFLKDEFMQILYSSLSKLERICESYSGVHNILRSRMVMVGQRCCETDEDERHSTQKKVGNQCKVSVAHSENSLLV